jgi:acyl carrier protein
MHNNSVKDRIKKFIIEHFPLARAKALGEDDHLLANGIMDSLGVLEVVTYLEAEFGFNVSDDELIPEHFQTIGCLTAFVLEKSGRQTEQCS